MPSLDSDMRQLGQSSISFKLLKRQESQAERDVYNKAHLLSPSSLHERQTQEAQERKGSAAL